MKRIILISLAVSLMGSCGQGTREQAPDKDQEDVSVVRKRRDDGTLSSVNQVDEDGYVHGIKVNYYEDGKTVHSKVSYNHGQKHGPALWYYKNGQVHEHTNYNYGRKDGLTKRYYDTGELMEELTFKMGEEQPGKKKYNRQGELIDD